MASEKISKCLVLLVLMVLMSLLATSAFSVPILKGKLYHIISEVNRKGPYIGLITVFPPEEAAFFSIGAFKPHPKHPFLDLSGEYI